MSNFILLPCSRCDHKTKRNPDLKMHYLAVHSYCVDCDLELFDKDRVLEHMEVEHKKKVRCEYCAFSSIERSNLLNHIKNRHLNPDVKPNSKAKPCLLCNEDGTLFVDDLKEHQITVHIYCEDCNLYFQDNNEIVEHLRAEHNLQLNCPYCEYVGLNTKSLRIHMRAKHKSRYLYNQTGQRRIVPLPKDKYFQCEKCNYTSPDSKYVLKMHYLSVHQQCQECNDIVFETKEETLDHMECHGFKVRCDQCSFTSLHPNNVASHVKTAHLKNTFTCFKCNNSREFKTFWKLRKHYYDQHLYCEVCDEEFNDKNSLVSHKESVHGEQLTCQNCGFLTTMKSILVNHLKICGIQEDIPQEESSETLHEFACKLCSSFQGQNAAELDEHYEYYHYYCEECDLKFRHRQSLQKHQRMKHNLFDPEKEKKAPNLTSFACSFCGSTKSYMHDLKKHNFAVHNFCIECNATFDDRRSVLQHMQEVHEMRTLCNYCEYGVIETRQLKIHVESVHGKSLDDPQELLVCAQCNFTTTFEHTLKQHEALKHAKATWEGISCDDTEPTTSEYVNIDVKVELMEEELDMVDCQFCESFTAQEPSELFEHYKIFHNYCEDCNQQFTSSKSIEQHFNEHHPQPGCSEPTPIIIPKEKEVVKKREAKKQLNPRKKQVFECTQCGAKKNNSYDVRKHMFAIHNYCLECKVDLKSRAKTLDHMEKVHDQTTKCQFCSFGAIEVRQLKIHMKKMHGEELPDKNNEKEPQTHPEVYVENMDHEEDKDDNFEMVYIKEEEELDAYEYTAEQLEDDSNIKIESGASDNYYY